MADLLITPTASGVDLTDSAGGTVTIDGSTPGGGGGGSFSSYSPTWTATTTNPNVGSTGSIVGQYRDDGAVVHYEIAITLGGVGVSAGSGVYEFSLPVTAALGIAPAGLAVFRRGGATFYARLAMTNTAGDKVQLTSDGGTRMTNATPAAPASGDTINISGSYRK